MKFERFKDEIKARKGTGYHLVNKYEEDAFIKFAAKGILVNDDYLEFINEIGFGSFFDGSLVFFQLDDVENSVIETTKEFQKLGIDNTTSSFQSTKFY